MPTIDFYFSSADTQDSNIEEAPRTGNQTESRRTESNEENGLRSSLSKNSGKEVTVRREKSPAPRTDVILGIQDIYMQQMVTGKKNYEFRKYRMKPTVERIWFYSIAPRSAIEYVCEIEPAVTRGEGIAKLPENGLGNQEFNEFHPDWDRYDFAYKILSVYKLNEPITLAALKQQHGLGGAPQGMVYTPPSVTNDTPWQKQAEKVW